MQELMIVEGFGTQEVTNRINEYLREGWSLHGDMTIEFRNVRDWSKPRWRYEDTIYCVQALVRESS